MENKFNDLRVALDQALSVDDVQDLIFKIAEEKINVARQEDPLMVYAETGYLYQLERFAHRRISELSDKRFGFLNAYFIQSRKNLDREVHNNIKKLASWE